MATNSSADLPVPSWKRTRAPSAPRPQLTREVIVDTALRLLDADGLDGVSMRRVADELGTGAASLYAHVANKEELLDLLLDRVAGEIEIPVADPKRWQDQLREICTSSYHVFKKHRDIAAVTLANVPTGINALRIAEGMFAIMLAGGVPPQVAGWAMDRFALYIAADAYEGSIHFNRQVASGLSMEDYVDKYFGGVQDFYRSLPKEQFPTITTHLESVMGGDDEQRFAFGLDMLIRSLATYVPE